VTDTVGRKPRGFSVLVVEDDPARFGNGIPLHY